MFENLKRMISFIGKDKYIHFTICLAITLVIYAIGSIWLGPVAAAPAFVIAILAGIAKERYDKTHGGFYDQYDIVADFLGCFLGLVIIALLQI